MQDCKVNILGSEWEIVQRDEKRGRESGRKISRWLYRFFYSHNSYLQQKKMIVS